MKKEYCFTLNLDSRFADFESQLTSQGFNFNSIELYVIQEYNLKLNSLYSAKYLTKVQVESARKKVMADVSKIIWSKDII